MSPLPHRDVVFRATEMPCHRCRTEMPRPFAHSSRPPSPLFFTAAFASAPIQAMLELRGISEVSPPGESAGGALGGGGRRGSSLSNVTPLLDASGAPLAAAAPEDKLPPEDKLLTLKMAIKMADLGNLSKGHDYTMAWTDRVLEEFFSQVPRHGTVGNGTCPLPLAPSRQ